MWRKMPEGLVCSACFEKTQVERKQQYDQKLKEEEAQVKAEQADTPKPLKVPLRKSTRMTRKYKTRANPYALPKPTVGRGRGRKGALRRAPLRTPSEGRTWQKTNRAYTSEGYLQAGDIVSLVEDNKAYYAQLRGFMCDLYGEKMGVVTWLLPTQDYKSGRFDPEHFDVGLDEDTPRRLDTMQLEYRVHLGTKRLGKPPMELLEQFVREPVQI